MATAERFVRLTRTYITLRGMARAVPVLLSFHVAAALAAIGLSEVLTLVALWVGLGAALVIALTYRRFFGVVVPQFSNPWHYDKQDWLLGVVTLATGAAFVILSGLRVGLNLRELGLLLGGVAIVMTGVSVGRDYRSWFIPATAIAVLTLTFTVPALSSYRAACHFVFVGTVVWAWTREHSRFVRSLGHA